MIIRVKCYPVYLRPLVVNFPLTSMSRRTSDLPGKGEGGAVKFTLDCICEILTCYKPRGFCYMRPLANVVFIGSARLSY